MADLAVPCVGMLQCCFDVPVAIFLEQFPANKPDKAVEHSSVFHMWETHMAFLATHLCGHLENEPRDGRSFSL